MPAPFLHTGILAGGDASFLRQLSGEQCGGRVPGKALYSCLLREDGGILDDLIAYFLSEDWFRLVVDAGAADKDLAWILAQRDRLAPELDVQPRRDLAHDRGAGADALRPVRQARTRTRVDSEALAIFQGVQTDGLFVAQDRLRGGAESRDQPASGGAAVRLWRDYSPPG